MKDLTLTQLRILTAMKMALRRLGLLLLGLAPTFGVLGRLRRPGAERTGPVKLA